jgi:type I restriction enzyme S subunit
VKNGWKVKTLEEACQFSNGLWKGEKPPFVNVGVIRNTNFTKEGTLDDSDIAYLDVEAKKLEKRRLQCGDIILEKSGGGPKQPVGRVALFDKKEGEFSFSNFTAALRILHPDELDFRYLHKFLHWTYLSGITEGMQSHSTGIRNLDGDAYKAIQVTYPPLPEQQRIVAILDEAFEGIATAKANAEKNLQNARAIFESHLQSVFTQQGEGWVEKRLDEVCTFSSGGTPSKSNSSYWSGKIPWISGRDMKSTRLSDSLLHISKSAVDESSTRMAAAGTLLILVRGMGLAHGAQIAELTAPCAFNQDIRGIHAEPSLIPRYLLFALRDRINSSDSVLSNAAHGTLKIDSRELHCVMIPIPSRERQQKIVKTIDSLSRETQRLASLYARKLEALEALKKSLLSQAFAGEL